MYKKWYEKETIIKIVIMLCTYVELQIGKNWHMEMICWTSKIYVNCEHFCIRYQKIIQVDQRILCSIGYILLGIYLWSFNLLFKNLFFLFDSLSIIAIVFLFGTTFLFFQVPKPSIILVSIFGFIVIQRNLQ